MKPRQEITEAKAKILAGIDRFIGEMAPYWNKSSFKALAAPYLVEDETVQLALAELVEEKVLHAPKDEEYYVVIRKDYLEKVCERDSKWTEIILDQAEEVESKLRELGFFTQEVEK